VIRLAAEIGASFRVRAIRLDSGNLGALARAAREKLDDAGLTSVRIFASGNLDEDAIAVLIGEGTPIDAFGVGTEMGVSADAPALDLAYKLVSYAGRGRVKLSPNKLALPGAKQVRRIEEQGVAVRDVLTRADEACQGRPLLVPVMRGGTRLDLRDHTIADARRRAAAEIARLPSRVRQLAPAMPPYSVEIGSELQREFDELAAKRTGGTVINK
jgi:nicotinate phosphoribosyltransferase